MARIDLSQPSSPNGHGGAVRKHGGDLVASASVGNDGRICAGCFLEHLGDEMRRAPLPAVDQVTPSSPCVLAHATNSAMLFAGRLGLTTMIDGATAIMPTGTRSESA
jgi:hypothetical protein